MDIDKRRDKICIFGNGAGAYSARVLAGMLHKVRAAVDALYSKLTCSLGRIVDLESECTARLRMGGLPRRRQQEESAGCHFGVLNLSRKLFFDHP